MSDTTDCRRSAPTITLMAPEGFEFLVRPTGEPEFRSPRAGDWFLSENSGPPTALVVPEKMYSYGDSDIDGKRFILKKKVTVVPAAQQYPKNIEVETVASVYGGDVSVPAGWEFVDFRPALLGENFLDSSRPCDVIEKACPTQLPRIIVRKSGNS